MESNKWTVLERNRCSKRRRLFPRTSLCTLFIIFFGTGTAIGQTQKVATHYSLGSAEVPAKVLKKARARIWKGNERGPVEDLMVYGEERSGTV